MIELSARLHLKHMYEGILWLRKRQ